MFSLNNNGLDVTCYTNRKICHTFGLKHKVIRKVESPNLVNDIQKAGKI
jgi:hypothetical protein